LSGLVLLIIFLIGLAIYKWETNTSPCIPDIPERIGKVPKTAKWIGGCDDGHWFDVVDFLPNNKYRIAIYFDHNGELYTDEYFKAARKCNVKCDAKYDSTSKILDDILLYSGYEIAMRSGCYLVPIKKIDKFENEFREQWGCK
jgi:hypothetical protein